MRLDTSSGRSNKRSEYAMASVLLFGMLAWLFYLSGLWHQLYFSYSALMLALVVSVLASIWCTRNLKLPPDQTLWQYLIASTLFWLVSAVLLFGATLGLASFPVFLNKTTEAHVFKFVKWNLGAYRSTGNLKFFCNALVVAESQSYMPNRQFTLCVDEFPPPRDRERVRLIEVHLTDLGYVAWLRSSRPPQVLDVGKATN